MLLLCNIMAQTHADQSYRGWGLGDFNLGQVFRCRVGARRCPMVQHRYRTAAIVGRWCRTRAQACKDALRAGLAYPDKSLPDNMLWAVPGEIETDRDGQSR